VPLLDVTGGSVEYLDIQGRDDLAPLVLLHHGVGSIAGWFRFHAALGAATGRRTVVYSRHGFGGSAPAGRPRTLRYIDHEACVVLPEILDKLGVAEPMLVGNSDGAAIALVHTAQSGRPVSGLALIGPLVYLEERGRRAIAQMGREYAEGDLRARVAMVHDEPDEAFSTWYDAWSGDDVADWSIMPVLGKVTCPTLLVYGSRDPFLVPEQIDVIESALGGPVTRATIRRGIHQTFVDHPRETLEAVVDFLSAHSESHRKA
jgi:pimeloyl-ACP methyl ester carboxylesterase